MKTPPTFLVALGLLGWFAARLAAQAPSAPAVGNGPPDRLNPGQLDSTHTATLRDQNVRHVYAEIETSKGVIEAELDFRNAPLTCLNFLGLAEGTLPFKGRPPGTAFYDGTTFHRVVKDFVIQGGDPLSADPAFPADKLGDGGPGYSVPDEFSPRLRHDAAGVLSMANDGPDTNGSQFFITLRETNRLNYLHSVFGQVVRGMEVVNRIEPGDKILHVTIKRPDPSPMANAATRGVDDPAPAPAPGNEAVKALPDAAGGGNFRATPQVFEALRKEVLAKRHPAAPEDFTYLEDDTATLPSFRVKNFNYKLANYERTTGHRLVVRLTSKFKPDPAGQSVGNVVKRLAETLRLPDSGDNVLAGFFAEPDGNWTLRLGEATYPALIGERGTTEGLMAGGALHRAKTDLLAPAQSLAKEGKLKESVDALIDTMILRLDDWSIKQAPSEP